MYDFSRITVGIDNTDNQRFRHGGDHSNLLGNAWLWTPTMLLSFRKDGPSRSGVPYLSAVASYLDKETQDLATGAKQYLFPDIPQYVDPTQRQSQNLDRTPAKSTVTESWPVVLIIGGLTILILTVGIHLSTGGTLNIGGR